MKGSELTIFIGRARNGYCITVNNRSDHVATSDDDMRQIARDLFERFLDKAATDEPRETAPEEGN